MSSNTPPSNTAPEGRLVRCARLARWIGRTEPSRVGRKEASQVALPVAQEGARKRDVLHVLQLVATGLSPFSGQAVHFLHYAPESLPYAKNRYVKEVARHYEVIEARLEESPYLAGADYTIADMALWGWARGAAYVFGAAGLSAYPHVERLVNAISERPAARAATQLAESAKLKTEVDEHTRRALFPQNL